MGYLDRIKPTSRPPAATAVTLSADGRTLHLTWEDGQRTRTSAQALRQACPCASCVDEWTRTRTFDPETIPADTRILDVRTVGSYALACTFSDAHQSGIFDWALLRQTSTPEDRPS